MADGDGPAVAQTRRMETSDAQLHAQTCLADNIPRHGHAAPGDPCGPRRIRPRLPAFCERSELCCVPPAIKIADPLDHSGAEPATSSFSQAQGHRLSIKLIYTNKTYYLLIILYNQRDPLDSESGEAITQVGPPAPGNHPGWRRDAEGHACLPERQGPHKSSARLPPTDWQLPRPVQLGWRHQGCRD